jgi:hypothetical protein
MTMLDYWKRLIFGTDSRHVDVSMLIIEALVFLLILIDFSRPSKDRFVAWRARKRPKTLCWKD